MISFITTVVVTVFLIVYTLAFICWGVELISERFSVELEIVSAWYKKYLTTTSMTDSKAAQSSKEITTSHNATSFGAGWFDRHPRWNVAISTGVIVVAVVAVAAVIIFDDNWVDTLMHLSS